MPATITPIAGGQKYTWTSVGKNFTSESVLVEGETPFSVGAPVYRPNIDVAVFGAFDTVTATIEGSFDGGTTWISLATFTTNGAARLSVTPEYLRVTTNSAGVGTTILTVVFLLRTPNYI